MFGPVSEKSLLLLLRDHLAFSLMPLSNIAPTSKSKCSYHCPALPRRYGSIATPRELCVEPILT